MPETITLEKIRDYLLKRRRVLGLMCEACIEAVRAREKEDRVAMAELAEMTVDDPEAMEFAEELATHWRGRYGRMFAKLGEETRCMEAAIKYLEDGQLVSVRDFFKQQLAILQRIEAKIAKRRTGNVGASLEEQIQFHVSIVVVLDKAIGGT